MNSEEGTQVSCGRCRTRKRPRQSDQVCRQYEPRERITGYWWPRTVSLPRTGKIIAKESGARVGGTET
jgi:hypothetical protein